jgi:hypothetical protein
VQKRVNQKKQHSEKKKWRQKPWKVHSLLYLCPNSLYPWDSDN